MDDFLEKPLVFLDLETTGTSISTDRICEIALIKTDDGHIIEDLHLYVDPEIPIPEEASKIHSLYRDQGPMAGAQLFKAHKEKIFSFLSGSDIAGHQIMYFDLPLLVEEFIRAGIDNFPQPGCKFVDTYRLQEKLFPRTLEFCYEQLTGKQFNHDYAHSARYDALCSLEVYQRQIKFKQFETANRNALHDMATRNNIIVDFAGKFKVNKNGLICYAFGKNEGKRVSSDLNYLDWMAKGDFTGDTKRWLHLCIKYHDEYHQIMNENLKS